MDIFFIFYFIDLCIYYLWHIWIRHRSGKATWFGKAPMEIHYIKGTDSVKEQQKQNKPKQTNKLIPQNRNARPIFFQWPLREEILIKIVSPIL